MSATFIEDFFPTPTPVIEKMLEGLDLDLIEDVLDLGSGRGVIAQHIVEMKESRRYESHRYHRDRLVNVDVVEINSDFHDVLRGKGFRLVHDDILTFETLKIYHLIIANFPFSIGAECLQRALALVERNGGHLRCLVNAETVKNPFTNLRRAVVRKLEELGAEIEYLTAPFASGERSTEVDAALIKLYVKRPEAPSIILDGLKRAESQQESAHVNNQLAEADFATAMVAQFNLEARAGIRLIEEYNSLRRLCLINESFHFNRGVSSKIILTGSVIGLPACLTRCSPHLRSRKPPKKSCRSRTYLILSSTTLNLGNLTSSDASNVLLAFQEAA